MMKATVLILAMLAGAPPDLAWAHTISAQTAQHEAPATTTADQPRVSIDATPIEVLEADADARALVIKHLGALFDHAAYPMIKSMTLKAIQPFSQGAITDEKLAALQADLDTLQ